MDYSIGYKLGNTGSAGESATYGNTVAGPSSWTLATVDFDYTGGQGVTLYLRVVNAGHSERAGLDRVGIEDLGGSGPQPTSTPIPTSTFTNTPGGAPTNTPDAQIASEDFESMPSWNSSWDAGWGSAASWSIQSGGQSGNYLAASRGSQGSSAKVLQYSVPTYTDLTVSIYMRCPTISGGYWMETACKFGAYSAQDFDANPGTWSMIRKFDSYGAGNGNGNAWTQYDLGASSGSNSQISMGLKLGSSGGGTPTVGWDSLLIEEYTPLGGEISPFMRFYGSRISRDDPSPSCG
jgi:hypothetical protein